MSFMPVSLRSLILFTLLFGSLFANEETIKDLAEHPPQGEAQSVVAEANDESEAIEEPGALAKFNSALVGIIFLDVTGGSIQIAEEKDGVQILDEAGQPKNKTVKIPLIVVILSLGSIFFTFWYRFINIRMFKHGLDVVRGKYDNPNNKGEISHFRALTSALSATVGLGNIAGVAVAIQQGGPGAVFWMICMAVFGMTAKFSSCTLSQLYRKTNPNGTISGGPMYYLDLGLKDLNLGLIGKILGILYAVMLMGGAVGGGNMFQVNQTAEAFRVTFDLPARADLAVGIMMLVVVGMVIVGGVRRIGSATSKIIPFMCGTYVLASVMIILFNIDQVPSSLALIFNMAFSENAIFGGAMGVLVTGVTRAAFSNEAGLGSAAVVHAAAKTDEPVREGVVAMLGPFIDTIVICTMTALVVIVTGAYQSSDAIAQTGYANGGVALTMIAFKSVASWLPYVLTISIALFAYSTMISWCYYGERGWIYLLDHFGEGKGLQTVMVFRLIFLAFILVGALNSLDDVLLFSDLMILSLAFPNILGSIILAPKVLRMLKDYRARLSNGEMKRYN